MCPRKEIALSYYYGTYFNQRILYLIIETNPLPSRVVKAVAIEAPEALNYWQLHTSAVFHAGNEHEMDIVYDGYVILALLCSTIELAALNRDCDLHRRHHRNSVTPVTHSLKLNVHVLILLST